MCVFKEFHFTKPKNKVTIMDPALLKERDAFMKRAKATPTVEKRKKPTESGADATKSSKKAKLSKPAPSPAPPRPPSMLVPT